MKFKTYNLILLFQQNQRDSYFFSILGSIYFSFVSLFLLHAIKTVSQALKSVQHIGFLSKDLIIGIFWAMSNKTKEQFIREKIRNFSIFIEKTIGADNKIYTQLIDFQKKPIEEFLQLITRLAQFAKKEGDEIVLAPESIDYFLSLNNVSLSSRSLEDKDRPDEEQVEIKKKINAYFSMFLNVINA